MKSGTKLLLWLLALVPVAMLARLAYAQDDETLVEIVNLEIPAGGSPVGYTVPSGTRGIALHAATGPVEMSMSEGGPTWTMLQGSKEGLQTDRLARQTFHFATTDTMTLEIRLLKGVL